MGNTLNGEDSAFYRNAQNLNNLTADLVEYTPSGGLSSTDIQAAIDEIEASALSDEDAIAFAVVFC